MYMFCHRQWKKNWETTTLNMSLIKQIEPPYIVTYIFQTWLKKMFLDVFGINLIKIGYYTYIE